MSEALVCDPLRTAIGRYAGVLSVVRADDLAAHPLKVLLERNRDLDPEHLDDVILGCANQAGEDNRNVARMALLLAGYPVSVSGSTVNRLCGSGLEAIGSAARAIRAGDGSMFVAGGVESMSRAPFVMGKAELGFSRTMALEDTTMGWRFINPRMDEAYGTESMPETAENVAATWSISREDQDLYALRSQQRAVGARDSGRFDREIIPVQIEGRKGAVTEVAQDEHPRADTSLERLAKLPTPFRQNGTVTAGNASGINDGACAMIVADEENAARAGLRPLARILGFQSVGVEPRLMGIGPVGASQRLLARLGLTIQDMDVIEVNEAFAAQALACLRELGLPDDAKHVNPNGGAIALGHPLGMSGARLVTTASHELTLRKGRYALCTMCVGVGQGVAMVLERL
ncbi:3-oxoadipyl-CoA thiolase [Fodinicurvata halophila]|uniref:3-oxoadipyl-CoA thiolase n=1 Tax=Fodinicurvata halophila TaxID=1419723 RepID=A0ABV8USI0_9PROT